MSETSERDAILETFNDKHARSWRREAGRPEIDKLHFPLGWVPLAWKQALRELINAGTVSIVDLPSRTNPARTASFLVLNDSAARNVTVTGVAAQFTGEELSCLARTAGEAVHGNIDDLSEHQLTLVERAYSAYMANDTAEAQPVFREEARTIDMDAVVAEVKARGHHAEVEMTGGYVATIFAGRQAPDRDGDLRWSAAAGPGWFEGPQFQRPTADATDFYIGPEYDPDAVAPPVSIPAGSTTAEIADLIVAVVEQDTRPHVKVRFTTLVAGTTSPDGWEQDIPVPAGTVGTLQRPVGVPAPTPEGWIWATVELDDQTVWVPAGPDMYEHV